MRTLRPVHAAVMLLCGFALGQAIGGALAIFGFAIAVATGGIDRSALEGPAGVMAVMANPLVLIPSAIGSSIGLVTVAVGAPLVLGVRVRDALALRLPTPSAWLLGPLGAIGLSIVADQAVFFFARAFPWLTLGALGAFTQAARVSHPAAAAGLLVGMAFVPGTCEEIFFRGAVQGALASRWRGAIAVAVTAFAFGVIHVDPPQALGATILGAYLGFVTLRTGSVGPAIAAHILNNALAFASANLPSLGGFGHGTPNPVPWSFCAAGALCAAVCAVAIGLLTRPKSPIIPA